MALAIQGLERAFTLQKGSELILLSDPNPTMSADQVMNFYTNTYPELTTATVQGPEIKEDRAVYSFRSTLGTKG